MQSKDLVAAIWVVFLWSMNLIVQKIAVAHLSIYILSFLRVALALPLLFFCPFPQKSVWKYALCGFFMLALYLILFGFGLKSDIGAGLSAFFLQTQASFIILCCFLLLGEKPTWFQVLGMVISFVGVYLLRASSIPAEVPLSGILLLLACGVTFGIGIAFSKKFQIGGSMQDIAWLSLVSSIPLLFSCFVFEGPVHTFELIINMDLTALYCVLFAVLASTIWATYIWLNLLQRYPAATVTPFMLLIPVFSNILSYLVMGESLTVEQMLAGFVIILGVMFAQKMYQHIPFVKRLMVS